MDIQNRPVLDIPQDTEAEQAVLGAIFMDNELLNDVAGILEPRSFHSEAHQHVFRAMLELTEENQPIDEILLADQLKSFGKLEEIGGILYLAELIECCPSSGNIPYYAKIIGEHALARELIATTNVISRKSRDPEQNLTELLAEADEKINDIALRIGDKTHTHIRDVLASSFARLEEISENKNEITGLPTGFIDLDNKTSGLQKSDLIIIAARPSMGKTALAINMATYIAKWKETKGAVVIFSMEMSKEQLAIRMLSSESRVNNTKLRNGNLEQEDWDRIAMSADKISELDLHVNDTANMSPYEITMACKKLNKELEDGVALVVVDYMQLMKGNKKTSNREQEIAEISRSMKALAKDLDIPVIALSQLNRALENRSDKHPQLSDLRESGSIEQDADIILFIYRDEVYDKDTELKGIAEIIIAKHRNGPTGTVNLVFRGEYTKFGNLARDEMPVVTPKKKRNPKHWNS